SDVCSSDLSSALSRADDRDVERPRTEVVQRQSLPRRELLPRERSEVCRRGHRLGNQRHRTTQAGLSRGGNQNVPANRSPLCRVRQPDLVRILTTELAHRLVTYPGQYRSERLADGHDIVTEQQALFVHPLLGIRLEPGGIQARLALRVPADEKMPTLLGEHRRRHTRRTVHLDNLGRPAMRGQHCHGVGCPEIHGQNPHSTPYRCENDAHILALSPLQARIGACPPMCCSCSPLPPETGSPRCSSPPRRRRHRHGTQHTPRNTPWWWRRPARVRRWQRSCGNWTGCRPGNARMNSSTVAVCSMSLR